MKAQRGVSALLYLFFSLGAGWGWVVNATSRLPYRLGTHCTGSWVGLGADVDGWGKSRPPPPGFELRTDYPVASRYTGCAILYIIAIHYPFFLIPVVEMTIRSLRLERPFLLHVLFVLRLILRPRFNLI